MSFVPELFTQLVLGDPVPVEQEELEADVLESLLVQLRQVKDEGLVEDRVQSPLLHVGLLLRDPLVVVQQVDLHVRV